MKRLSFSQLKEVPYEITFFLRDAERDRDKQTHPNRYWFELPESWVDAVSKDPIIGIRSIYATKTNRFIRYTYTIELISRDAYDLDPETEDVADMFVGEIRHWLDGADTIKVLTDYFNNHWLDNGHRVSDYGNIDPSTPNNTGHIWEQSEIHCHYEYKEGYIARENIYYSGQLCLVFGRGFLDDVVWIDDEYGLSRPYVYRISIMPVNWDTATVFSIDSLDTITERTNIILPTWSRYQCLVKSSLADMDKNNVLGHTRNDPYNPIKYFRFMDYGSKKFWIELYETRYPDCPVVIPEPTGRDNHEDDDVIIEAIFCFSSDGML